MTTEIESLFKKKTIKYLFEKSKIIDVRNFEQVYNGDNIDEAHFKIIIRHGEEDNIFSVLGKEIEDFENS